MLSKLTLAAALTSKFFEQFKAPALTVGAFF
jgi:hypothetical protein